MKGENVIKQREACPGCGYKLATVNEERGIVHCASCHRTFNWPTVQPKVPASERLTAVLAGLFDQYQGDESAVMVSSTAFHVPFDGEELIVKVRRPKAHGSVS